MKQKLLLSLLFILTATKALADFTVGGILYRSAGDYAVVATGVNGVTTGDITIPEVIAHEGWTYVVLGIEHGSFKGNTRITSLTINAPVTELAGSEFQGCTSLASVTLPGTLKTIGSYAFYGSGLTSITIPASVDSIGRGIFTHCDALKTLKIEDKDIPLRFGNDYWNGTSGTDELCTSELNSFYMGRDIVTDVTDSRIVTSAKKIELAGFVTTVRNNFSRSDTLLQTLIVGGNAANIGTKAFHGCLRLTDVSITAAIDTIHQSAFEGCTALTVFSIPETTTSIGSYAFYSTGLTSITIPASVDSIGRGVFTHCDALKTLKIEDKDIPLRFGNDYWNGTSGTDELCTSELNSFYMGRDIVTDVTDSRIVTSAKKIELAGFVTTVRNNFSRSDTLLQTLIVGGNAANIGTKAFHGCLRLTDVSITAAIDTIHQSAFEGCTALATFSIPETTTSIGSYAFYGTGLTSVTIPASVDSIGRGVFTHCDALKTLKIEDKDIPLRFGNDFWNGTNGTNELCTTPLDELYVGRPVKMDQINSIAKETKVLTLGEFFAGSDHVSQNFNGLFSKLIVTDAVNVPWFAPMFIEASTFAKVTYDQAYLFVPSAESVEAYSRQPSWSLFLHIAQGTYEQEEEVIILLDNVASFSSERDLDFSGSDLKAYVCTGIERKTNRVVMTRVNDVAAGTGLLLVGMPGIAYKVPCTPHSSTYDNLLQANIAESVIEPTSVNGRVNYIFDESTTDASAPSSRMEATEYDMGFLAIDAPVTLPGKKAYLQLPSIIAMSGTSIGVVLNDEVITGSPLIASPEEEELIYNLAGQRLSKKQKGFNIVGSRKVMVK